MLGERLCERLKLCCHKNPIQNIVVDWLLNGNVSEKNDATIVISNCEEALKVVNGLNHQINPDFNKHSFYCKVNDMIHSLLTDNEDYSNLKTRNRKNIEVRGWLLTVYAQTIVKDSSKALTLLKQFLSTECDRKVTTYWALVSILYFYDHFETGKKLKFANDYFDKIAIIPSRPPDLDPAPAPTPPTSSRASNSSIRTNMNTPKYYDRIYWLFIIWNVNEDSEKATEYTEKLVSLLSKSGKDRSGKENKSITELFAALSFRPCIKIITEMQKFIDNIIEKDHINFWEEKDIHMYKYLILCLRQYGLKEFKKAIGDEQVNIYYKILKLLTITRSYSSRIWNEIKLQLLKSIRVYSRTTQTQILDELKEELLNSDLSIVFEACKTLKSIYELDRCLEIIVKVLYTKSLVNVVFDERRIFAVSYSLKILSIKDSTVMTKLKEMENSYDDYSKKNIVRKLFIEMGGIQAIKRSQVNADIREKYMNMTCKAQGKVETMFEKSISDAKSAFKVSLAMNVIVFLVGIILLATSGILAITSNTQDKWAGVGVSSGTGFLSVVYSLFINKPSRKIRKNTNHLMRLKVIFLGYLRELTQMDQSFSKNLIDADTITEEVLDKFVSKIKGSMNNALTALRWEELLNRTSETVSFTDVFADQTNTNDTYDGIITTPINSTTHTRVQNALRKVCNTSTIIVLNKDEHHQTIMDNLTNIDNYIKELVSSSESNRVNGNATDANQVELNNMFTQLHQAFENII